MIFSVTVNGSHIRNDFHLIAIFSYDLMKNSVHLMLDMTRKYLLRRYVLAPPERLTHLVSKPDVRL